MTTPTITAFVEARLADFDQAGIAATVMRVLSVFPGSRVTDPNATTDHAERLAELVLRLAP